MIKLALVNITKDMECPPLTLAYIATYLKEHMKDKIEISIVDINFENPIERILQLKPDVVGISSMTVKYNYAKKLAGEIKKNIKAHVIIGGIHISTCPESFSRVFDIGVIGEGEKTMLELMKLFEKNHSFPSNELEKINGLVFLQQGRIARTAPRELTNLDEIPIPNRKFLDKRYLLPKVSYNKLRGKKVIEAGIMTSRGCPYKCIFCSTSRFWSRIRFHSADYVAKEIEYLVKDFSVDYIVVYDDLFASDIARVKKIYDKLKKDGIIGKVKFTCSLRANLVNEKICKILKEIGIVTVNFGFESGSDKILNYLKGESVTVEQNKNAVLLCRKYGFDVNGSFMLGSPTETIEDMRKTLELIEWMKHQGATELWCGVTKPYPATKLWNYALEHGLINKNFNWDLTDPSYIHNPVFLDKSVSKKEFFRIFKEVKSKSFSTSLRKGENKAVRKIKDAFYYNTFLHESSRMLVRMLPRPIVKTITKTIGANETALGIMD